MAMRRKVIAGAAAALAVGGAGAGVAATKLADSRSAESQAIVKQVAESHGGSVVAEQPPDGGTVMRLRLNGRTGSAS